MPPMIWVSKRKIKGGKTKAMLAKLGAGARYVPCVCACMHACACV